MDKVSIIIPVFNTERFLKQAVESALAQDWINKEIIIVDDGSTDNSLNIAKSYESRIVKVISIQNSGQCIATNVGLSFSQGDYIQYLDADDLLDQYKISNQINILKDLRNIVAIGAWARFYNDISDAVFLKEELWASMSPVEWLCCQWRGGGMMANSAYLIPRNLCEKAGNYNERLNFNNDFEYFSRVVLCSDGVEYCADSKSYYRSNISTSLSKQKSVAATESEYFAKKLAIDNILKISDDSKVRECCASAMFSFIYDLNFKHKMFKKLAYKDIKDLGVSNFPIQQDKLQFASKVIGWKGAIEIKKFIDMLKIKI